MTWTPPKRKMEALQNGTNQRNPNNFPTLRKTIAANKSSSGNKSKERSNIIQTFIGTTKTATTTTTAAATAMIRR